MDFFGYEWVISIGLNHKRQRGIQLKNFALIKNMSLFFLILHLHFIVFATEKISISGVSSGGYMAEQFAIAHSDLVFGLGVFSAGIPGCVRQNNLLEIHRCMKSSDQVNLQEIQMLYRAKEKNQIIARLDFFKEIQVHIYHGQQDQVVTAKMMSLNQQLIESFGAKVSARLISNLAHGLPVFKAKNQCEKTASPWINQCEMSGALDLFSQLYRGRFKQNRTDGKWFIYHLENELLTDDEINKSNLNTAMASYVPSVCEKIDCPVHMVLHGCQQSPEFVDEQFLLNSDFVQAANQYGVVLLFPSINKSSRNPYGCWDWWGYTGIHYDDQLGPQIRVLEKIVRNKHLFVGR